MLSGRNSNSHIWHENSLATAPVETRVSIKRNFKRIKNVIQSLPFTRALCTLECISFADLKVDNEKK